MKRSSCWSLAAWAVCIASLAVAQERREKLLDVTGGRVPNDTASDGQTKFSFLDNADLGGKALKVDLAGGDSFGNKGIGPKNWKEFVAVEFSAINPTSKPVPLVFSVRHARTTSYQTRCDSELTLQPGKNTIRLGVDEMLNVNGTVPDLANVTQWYFSGTDPVTLLFGDISLIGGEQPASGSTGGPAAIVGGAVKLEGKYRITGKIKDNGEVDLILSPVEEPPAAQPQPRDTSSTKKITTDPKRLARIRAAKMPSITRPVMFDTPEADAIVSALEIFPPDNAINQVITDWPLHPNSKAIVATVGLDKPLRYNPDMAYILVPPDQKRVAVKIVEYPDESDAGPYPVPDNTPIEGWPVSYERDGKPLTLAAVQQRPADYEGDRHALVVDPTNRKLYEFFTFGRTRDGWAAGQASIFDLTTNELRPEGWTSADAAGLPIFPLVVRYDELQRGEIEHALRVTIRRTRRAYVHPATHFASRLDDENLPRMGERFRLRADFDTSDFTPEVKTILQGLKKYGMLVADNGIEWAISVTPDRRIPNLHEELRKVKGSDFEVVVAP
jgi:hypothetical protein